MKSPEFLSHRKLPWLLAGLACLSAPATAAEPSLTTCRTIADDAQRLRCYDAIVVAPAPAARAPSAAPATAAPAAPAATQPPPSPEARFGLPARPAPAAPPAEPESIESAIAGRFEGWTPRGRLTLANGQVWEIVDGSQGTYDLASPKVKITRGSFGGFFLSVEGVGQTPRVRRVR